MALTVLGGTAGHGARAKREVVDERTHTPPRNASESALGEDGPHDPPRYDERVRPLLSNEYYEVTLDEARGLVRARRTPQSFPGEEVTREVFGELVALAQREGPRAPRLLLDSRDGPYRPDASFERVLAERRDDLLLPFARRALLVKTLRGALQAQRLQRTLKGPELATFSREEEAILYLLAGPLG